MVTEMTQQTRWKPHITTRTPKRNADESWAAQRFIDLHRAVPTESRSRRVETMPSRLAKRGRSQKNPPNLAHKRITSAATSGLAYGISPEAGRSAKRTSYAMLGFAPNKPAPAAVSGNATPGQGTATSSPEHRI
jgi:hypothetical protein